MLRYSVRRFGQLLLVVAALSVLLFAWLRSLPGGPVSALLGDRATAASRAQLEAALGLDQSVGVQYLRFLGRAISGDFGVSTGVQPGEPALSLFLQRLPATVELAFLAILLAVAAGIPLGCLAARRRGGWLDNAGVIGSLVGVAVPVFFLAYILKYVFSVKLGWFPTQGRDDPRIDADHPTGLYVLDGIITGNLEASWDAIMHLVLPAIALGAIPLAIIVRITRASVLDVVHEDYVRTAEAKGLFERTITRRHVLRNALVPAIQGTALALAFLTGGVVIIEQVFNYPGLGRALVDAVNNRDLPVIQVICLIFAASYVVFNLIGDVLTVYVTPRLRTGA
ncbi:MAG: ABC transporter permease [Actinomycetes bacterium]